MTMQTITFYAYKGGTGRTLALTKAARFLAKAGKRVFVLDLDLEAPGLHFKLLDEEQRRDLCPGLVELAHEYKHAGTLSSLDHHYVRVKPEPGAKGEILLMPAGRALSNDYWRKLTELDWQQMFGDKDGHGIPLFLRLRELIQDACDPDYLLIDARTGVTEVGGAALTLLADAVVCLFSNNEESKWGTREAIWTIAESDRLPEMAPVRIVPVLARFPPGEANEEELTEEIRSYMNELARPEGPPLRIERIFVLHSYRELEVDEQRELGEEEARGSYLKGDYDQLFREGLGVEIESLAVGGTVAAAQRAAGTGEAVTRWLEVIDRLLEHEESTLVDVLAALGDLESELGADSRHEEVLPRLQRVMAWPGATAEVRATAAQLLALVLARLDRFGDIPAEILAAASAPGLAHQDTLRRLLLLKGQYDELKERIDEAAPARHRVYEAIVEDLADRLEAVGDLASAIEVLRSRLQALDEDRTPIALRIRRRLGNLLRAAGQPIDAEVELRRTAAGYRLRGEEDAARQVQADLARVLEEPQRPDEVKALGKRLVERERPPVPAVRPLPEKRPRASRSGPGTDSFAIPLQLVTPLLGGAAETRKIDEIDIIRAPSIRGHLRFWWRALARESLSSVELYERERALWGGIGDDAGTRSTVELRIEVTTRGEVDHSDVVPYGREPTPGAYALWPARKTTRGPDPQPVAPRRMPGTCFLLQVTCRTADRSEVEAAIRAWILFGGYGGRTRRGAGSLAIDGKVARSAEERPQKWLPADWTRDALRAVFQHDVLAPIAGRRRDDIPLLAGAGLRLGPPTRNAMDAWMTALHWLRDFRQEQPRSGQPGSHDSRFARERGDNRPGRSNWPEADKVRRLSEARGGTRWAHEPHHNDTPVWPRAGFGLPIVAQFQRTDRRTRAAYPPPGEPADFELRWRDADGKPHDRLASPLIVKALALADGGFAPCALWLYRAYPSSGEVILHPKDSRSRGSEAGFDELVARGDKPRYAWLDRPKAEPLGEHLRNAFFDWLAERHRMVRVVAP